MSTSSFSLFSAAVLSIKKAFGPFPAGAQAAAQRVAINALKEQYTVTTVYALYESFDNGCLEDSWDNLVGLFSTLHHAQMAGRELASETARAIPPRPYRPYHTDSTIPPVMTSVFVDSQDDRVHQGYEYYVTTVDLHP